MDILTEIECHLDVTSMSPSAFGRLVCNDPRLVFDMRRGRSVQPVLKAHILNHIANGTKRDRFS